MPIKVKAGGLWKDAVPKVKVGGLWKDASSYVKAGGLWYQASSNSINIIIDSATTLYDFNLKAYMQSAGIWPASGPVVINELRITARTVITHLPLAAAPPAQYGSKAGAAPAVNGYTLLKEMPAGLVTSNTSGGTTNYTEYMHDVWLYRQDLTKHAFTTGDAWPSGSRIGNFIVEGSIVGRGGDGAGVYGDTTFYDTQKWAVTGSTSTAKTISTYSARDTVLYRHGWPSLHTTVPITTLNAVGKVAGGGAGGCYPSPLYYTYAQGNATQRAEALAQVAAFNAKSRPMDEDAFFATGRGTGSTLYFQSTMAGSAASAAHGCGGGQGGGKGGKARALSNTSTNTWVLGVEGGDGTLSAPGGAGTSTVSYNSTDTKYGGVPSKMVGGGVPGAALGADALHKLSVVYTNWAGEALAYFDNTPAAEWTVDIYGTIIVSVPTKTMYSQGGDAITGASLITNITGNLYGRRV